MPKHRPTICQHATAITGDHVYCENTDAHKEFGVKPLMSICYICPFYKPSKTKLIIKKAKKPSLEDYAAAEFSLLLHGPVPLPIFEHRKQCCTGSPCQHWRKEIKDSTDEIGFCGSCGCGGRERAKLSTKLQMPKATCPKGVWGEEKGEGILQLKRIGGVVKQVQSIIKGIKEELKGKEAPDGK